MDQTTAIFINETAAKFIIVVDRVRTDTSRIKNSITHLQDCQVT